VELHQGRGLGRVVGTGLYGVGVPALGEEVLGIDPLDGDLQGRGPGP
jgi:hypothetical protein